MDMEYKSLRILISIRANIRKESSMVKENIFGLMGHLMKELL